MPLRSLPDIPFRLLDDSALVRPTFGLRLGPALSVGSAAAGLFAHIVCAWRTAMRNAELFLFLAAGAPAPGMLHLRPSWTVLAVIAVRWHLSTLVSRPARVVRRARLGENLDFTSINVNNLAGLLSASRPGRNPVFSQSSHHTYPVSVRRRIRTCGRTELHRRKRSLTISLALS